MIRRLTTVALVGLVVFSLALSTQGDGSRSDAERVEQLSEQLRCPVCDGLAVADSPSSTARAIAADIRSRVAGGETDEAIRTAYVAQYGEWILLEPPAGGFGVLAWGLPVGLVVGGAGAGAWVLRRRATSAVPSPAEREAVARALGGADR